MSRPNLLTSDTRPQINMKKISSQATWISREAQLVQTKMIGGHAELDFKIWRRLSYPDYRTDFQVLQEMPRLSYSREHSEETSIPKYNWRKMSLAWGAGNRLITRC